MKIIIIMIKSVFSVSFISSSYLIF